MDRQTDGQTDGHGCATMPYPLPTHIEIFMGYDFSIEFCMGLTTVYVISGYGETLQSITNLNTA